MAKDPLDELLQFLSPDSRLDLKHISLEHLVGISGSDEGINTLSKNEKILQRLIELTDDKVDEISKNALLFLVNVSANAKGATELLKCDKNLVSKLIGYILDPQKKYADAACMTLSNITRVEDTIESTLESFFPHLNDMLNAFVNTNYNKQGSKLHYLSSMFSNLTCNARIRKWLVTEHPHVPLIKLLPFCNYEHSNIRRGGAIGTVRNLSFDSEYHDYLLSRELDLLTYILNPLIGNEEYADDEMDKLPIGLQYLIKERETDVDIRKMIIETLNKLCMKRNGREMLRENGVYYILREYHKWEKDSTALLAIENVVDILIQKEEEVGADDLSMVNVPEDMKEKFDKMDEEYVNSVK